MDTVLVNQYEAVWWQNHFHEEDISAAVALALFCGQKPVRRYLAGLDSGQEEELV